MVNGVCLPKAVCDPAKNLIVDPNDPTKCICAPGYYDDGNGHCCPADHIWSDDENKCIPDEIPDDVLSFTSSVHLGGFFNTEIEGKFPIIFNNVSTYIDAHKKTVTFFINTEVDDFKNNPYSKTLLQKVEKNMENLNEFAKINKEIVKFTNRTIDGESEPTRFVELTIHGNKYITTDLPNKFTVGVSGKNYWPLKPANINQTVASRSLSESSILAKVTHGFLAGEKVLEITFDKVKNTYIGKIDTGVRVPEKDVQPIIIALETVQAVKNTIGIEHIAKVAPTKQLVFKYLRAALLNSPLVPGAPSFIPQTQGGGRAIIRMHNSLDDIPYIMTLQKLWEDKNKHYKALEPEYQQMLPPPDEAPVNSIKDPFHEYMDQFGDQQLLEEARDTIGMMKPEEAEDLFINDNSHVNEIYENALPEINRDWIPIFIRADMLRLLSRKR
jgi:hypothetical protein